jgi:hypothetical protein
MRRRRLCSLALNWGAHFAASAGPSAASELAVENERGGKTLAFTLVIA